MPPLKAVPYLRVSTDDKGQDPLRQLDLIRQWCQREGPTLLPEVVDEGTSAFKVNPFDRPMFVRAIERAKEAGAEAIIVETADRFTRMGADEFVYGRMKLDIEYGLKLWMADIPYAEQGLITGQLIAYLRAYQGHDFSLRLSRRTKEGIALKKAKGVKFGRPPKLLTPQELAMAMRLKAEGKGDRKIAQAINEARGVHRLATKEAQKARQVSFSVVRRAIVAARSEPKVNADAKVESSEGRISA